MERVKKNLLPFLNLGLIKVGVFYNEITYMDVQNSYKTKDVTESTESISMRLRKYFESQPISKAWLFGSRSRGDYREDSDYDILVAFDNSVGLFKYADIMSDLEELLNKTVDLVSETSLLPWVKDEVEKEKVLIYEREAKRQR